MKRRIQKKKNSRFIRAFNALSVHPKSKKHKKEFLKALKEHSKQ